MTSPESKDLEDNLPMVNYIMLHRIYDMLALIANKVAGGEEVNKMIEYHTQGFLLGPSPAYSSENEEDDEKQN
jgi:hypothetical protein